MAASRAAAGRKRSSAKGPSEAIDQLSQKARKMASYDVLPADIWKQIFSLLPPRPRLHVLALVCKRWCAYARATFTALRAPDQEHIEYSIKSQAWKAFPALTEIDLRNCGDMHIDYIPPQLCSILGGTRDQEDELLTQVISKLSTQCVTHMRVNDHSARVLPDVASSLTSLELVASERHWQTKEDAARRYLQHLRLPLLRSLKIGRNFTPLIMMAEFVTCHMSQLVSLEIPYVLLPIHVLSIFRVLSRSHSSHLSDA